MKTIIKIVIILYSINSSIAQNSDTDLHNKYWYYKARYNNDFVVVGPNAGQSIPFNQRGFADTYDYGGPSQILKTGDGAVQLGIYVGVLATEYRLLKDKGQDVSIVKNELFYALNAINRIDYFAEKLIGEHPMNTSGSSSSPNLNGFFMRDDIPPGFVKNHYNQLNYYNDGIDAQGNPKDTDYSDKGFTQINPTGQLITEAGYSSFIKQPFDKSEWNNPNNNESGQLSHMEESQDQLYYLLLGTTLASKLVDAGETDSNRVFGFGSGETELRKEAINISDRLIKHVKNSAGGMWTVRNPANGNAFVQIGHSALSYAFGLDNLGCFIKYNQDFPSYSLLSPNVQNSCNDYRNVMSGYPLGTTSWGTLVGIDGGPTVDMQGFYHALSSTANCTMESRNFLNTLIQAQINAIQAQISNVIDWLDQTIHNTNIAIGNLPSWATNLISNLLNIISNAIAWTNTIIDTLYNLINSLTQSLFGVVKQNTTQERLINNHYFNVVNYNTCSGDPLATHLGSKNYFGVFAHRVLHQQLPLPSWMQIIGGNPTSITYPILRNELKSVLEQAPCIGNYNFYPISRPGPEWGNPNRLDRMDPTYRYNLECPTGFLGEYHGLDYMLLHNLYYLSGSTSKFENLDERVVNENYPYSNGMFSKSNPKTKGAFEHIKYEGTINQNANVIFRAGKTISFKSSNFYVAPGADFHARIEPYQCSSDIYNGEFNKSSPQNNQENEERYSHYTQEYNDVISNFNNYLDSLIKYPEIKYNTLYAKINVYPNPNSGTFNISFNLEREDNVNVLIIDATGKEVYNQKYITGILNYEIDLKKYSSGVYLLIAKNTTGETFTKKIIISNEKQN